MLSNILTNSYYPIAVQILNYLEISELVNCFHAFEKFQSVTTDVLKKRRGEKGWTIYGRFNEDFLKEFHPQLKWNDISKSQVLSESFIREFSDKVDWTEISWNQTLSEEFMIEFEDKLDWRSISAVQKLSENFIRRFQHKLDWYQISSRQELSEEFMREFKNKIYWNVVKRKYQLDLSIGFMLEFQFLMEDLCLVEKKGLKRKLDNKL